MVSADKSACESVAAGSTSGVGVDNLAGTATGSGKWTRAGSQATNDIFDCPAGSYCDAGVITTCPAGTFCVEGSSTDADAPAGTVQDEGGLTFDKKCPAGYTCEDTAGSAAAQATAGLYSTQGQ